MLKNNGKQHLLFTLPEGFANVATSINDISVKPQKSGEQLRLPIPGGLIAMRDAREDQLSQKTIPYAKTPIWPASNRCLQAHRACFRCAQHL